MITTIGLVNIHHLMEERKERRKEKEKKKTLGLVVRILRPDCLNNFHIYHTTVLAIVTVLCIISVGLIYLITESLYLLIIFLQFFFSLTSGLVTQESDVFFMSFCLYFFYFLFIYFLLLFLFCRFHT